MAEESSPEDRIVVPKSSNYMKNTQHWEAFRKHRIRPTIKRGPDHETRHGVVVVKQSHALASKELQECIVRQKTLPILRKKTFK